jgi:hypothetical protein
MDISILEFKHRYQSLVGLVVINAEFGMEKHSLIPATTLGRVLKPLNDRTNIGSPYCENLISYA